MVLILLKQLTRKILQIKEGSEIINKGYNQPTSLLQSQVKKLNSNFRRLLDNHFSF